MSSSEGRNDAAALRMYSPVESPAALACLTIRAFPAFVTITGIRAVAVSMMSHYAHVQHMDILDRPKRLINDTALRVEQVHSK